MGDDLAASNVNRSYSLAATSIAIFTFMLVFLYPRFAVGAVNGLLFQATLVVMGFAVFSFVFGAFYYYGSSLGGRIDDAERARYSRRGDRFWLLGCTLLFGSELDPLLGRSSCRRVCVVRPLADVRALPDPLLPPRPDRAQELGRAPALRPPRARGRPGIVLPRVKFRRSLSDNPCNTRILALQCRLCRSMASPHSFAKESSNTACWRCSRRCRAMGER